MTKVQRRIFDEVAELFLDAQSCEALLHAGIDSKDLISAYRGSAEEFSLEMVERLRGIYQRRSEILRAGELAPKSKMNVAASSLRAAENGTVLDLALRDTLHNFKLSQITDLPPVLQDLYRERHEKLNTYTPVELELRGGQNAVNEEICNYG